MNDNTRTAIRYVCITLMIITWLLLLAWIASPTEFTFKLEMDNNTKVAIESIEWESLYEQEEVWNCPILLEQGNYVFSNGILISPSGEELSCEKVRNSEEK